MKLFRSYFNHLIAVTFLCLAGIGVPGVSMAQCSYAGGGMGVSPGIMLISVHKSLTKSPTASNCNTTLAQNALCDIYSSNSLRARHYTGGTGPTPVCQWNCDCGTVRIDGPNDGLPVELMEFSVSD